MDPVPQTFVIRNNTLNLSALPQSEGGQWEVVSSQQQQQQLQTQAAQGFKGKKKSRRERSQKNMAHIHAQKMNEKIPDWDPDDIDDHDERVLTWAQHFVDASYKQGQDSSTEKQVVVRVAEAFLSKDVPETTRLKSELESRQERENSETKVGHTDPSLRAIDVSSGCGKDKHTALNVQPQTSTMRGFFWNRDTATDYRKKRAKKKNTPKNRARIHAQMLAARLADWNPDQVDQDQTIQDWACAGPATVQQQPLLADGNSAVQVDQDQNIQDWAYASPATVQQLLPASHQHDLQHPQESNDTVWSPRKVDDDHGVKLALQAATQFSMRDLEMYQEGDQDSFESSSQDDAQLGVDSGSESGSESKVDSGSPTSYSADSIQHAFLQAEQDAFDHEFSLDQPKLLPLDQTLEQIRDCVFARTTKDKKSSSNHKQPSAMLPHVLVPFNDANSNDDDGDDSDDEEEEEGEKEEDDDDEEEDIYVSDHEDHGLVYMMDPFSEPRPARYGKRGAYIENIVSKAYTKRIRRQLLDQELDFALMQIAPKRQKRNNQKGQQKGFAASVQRAVRPVMKFIEEEGVDVRELEPMNPAARKAVRLVADQCNVRTTNCGVGKKRSLRLHRTAKSHCIGQAEIDKIIDYMLNEQTADKVAGTKGSMAWIKRDVASLMKFIEENGVQERDLEPMNPISRKAVHLVAERCNVITSSYGSGAQRRVHLTRTRNSFCIGPAEVDQIIDNMLKYPKNFTRTKKNDQSEHGKASKTKKKNRLRRVNGVPREHGARSARVVSTRSEYGRTKLQEETLAANPIHETNIGHTLLRKMGWSEGSGLGAKRNGIVVPVVPTLRPERQGLR